MHILQNSNITECTGKTVVHGVNCLNTMGAGAARAIANKWPEAEKAYDRYMRKYASFIITTKKLPEFEPCCYAICDDGTIVYNAIVQYYVGRDKKYGQYHLLTQSLSNICKNIISSELSREIHITKIGCGLAGLKWEVLSEILLEYEENYGVTFYVHCFD